MKYSARLVTALAAVALLVAAIVGLRGEFMTAQASHGTTHTDGTVFLTNNWSNLTTESAPPSGSGRTFVGSGKSLYSTVKTVTSASATTTFTNIIRDNADKLTITVVDADQNVAVNASTTVTYTATTTNGQSVAFQLTLGSPVVDSNNDGVINASDITILSSGTSTATSSRLFVSNVNPGTETVAANVTLTATATINNGETVDIQWKTSAQDVITGKVTVKTTQVTSAVTINLRETGRSTGRFEGFINLHDVVNTGVAQSSTSTTNTAGDTVNIATQNGSTITVEYTDSTPVSGTSIKATATAVVSTPAPTISVNSPVNKIQTQERQPQFAGSISTGPAGVKANSGLLILDKSDASTAFNSVTTTMRDLSITTDSGSFLVAALVLPTGTADGVTSVSWTFTPGSGQALPNTTVTTPNNKIGWGVRVTDLAGNVGLSDSDATKALEQQHEVTVKLKAPALSAALTGNFWDTSLTTPAVGKNKATSIEVQFDSSMDASSIENTDFTYEIAGVSNVPTAATVFSDLKTSVFLTLPTAISADAKPIVRVVAAVRDVAGNSIATGSVTATDKLAPTVTTVLSGGSSTAKPAELTNGPLTITITTDEALSTNPTVEVYAKGNSTTTVTTVSAINQGGNKWIATLVKVGTDSERTIKFTATDTASNDRVIGSATTTDSTAIKYTQDSAAPVAGLGTSGTASQSTDERRPFVVLAFDEAVATINKATLGGSDISASLSASTDRKNWIYKPANDLDIKAHTIVVQATDDAANKSTEATLTLTVTERKAFELPLKPGWNLVSLRSDPADPSINSVVTVSSVQTVIAYNPSAQGGPWIVATRGGDGKLVGSLTTMDANRGYWVNTTSFEPIKVSDPKPAGGSLPPSIPLMQGWNLVPARDVTGTKTAGTTIASASQYFTGANVTRAYTFDTIAGTYSALTLSGTTPSNILVGSGYWVYASAAGAILP